MANRTKAKGTASKVPTSRKAVAAKVSKAKAPSKADLERKATKAQIAKAHRMMQGAASQDALFTSAATAWGKGNIALLAIALHLNSLYAAKAKALGFMHFYGLTGDACKTPEQKALLTDLNRTLEELKATFYQAWLDGKGGDSNTNRVVSKVLQEAYKAIYGSLPRKVVYDIFETAEKACAAAYKKSLGAENPDETFLTSAKLIAAFLTHRGVDVAKINQSVG